MLKYKNVTLHYFTNGFILVVFRVAVPASSSGLKRYTLTCFERKYTVIIHHKDI